MSPHPLFRNEAIKQALRQQERQTLPRFTSLPVAIFLWLLIGLTIATGYIAWNTQIPTYTNGSGIILAQKDQLYPRRHVAEAAIFLSASQKAQVRSRQTLLITINGTQQQIRGNVIQISTQMLSPLNINKRYMQGSSLVTQPSYVAIAELPGITNATFEGSTLSVNIQTGSQRIFAWLTGMGN
jgi:hypothetical protein